MEVSLIAHTPLSICVKAIRSCWDSHEKGGCYIEQTDNVEENDKKLIERVVNKMRHSSTAEHVNYTFHIQGISRALLQELARHRIASLSVKSTRYTLKELKAETVPLTSLHEGRDVMYKRASQYLVLTGEPMVDNSSLHALENLRKCLVAGISNDKAKYCLPESYKTSLTWTINMRSLQNFLYLRSDKSALWEIRELAHAVYDALPDDHKFMLCDSIKDEQDVD